MAQQLHAAATAPAPMPLQVMALAQPFDVLLYPLELAKYQRGMCDKYKCHWIQE